MAWIMRNHPSAGSSTAGILHFKSEESQPMLSRSMQSVMVRGSHEPNHDFHWMAKSGSNPQPYISPKNTSNNVRCSFLYFHRRRASLHDFAATPPLCTSLLLYLWRNVPNQSLIPPCISQFIKIKNSSLRQRQLRLNAHDHVLQISLSQHLWYSQYS